MEKLKTILKYLFRAFLAAILILAIIIGMCFVKETDMYFHKILFLVASAICGYVLFEILNKE